MVSCAIAVGLLAGCRFGFQDRTGELLGDGRTGDGAAGAFVLGGTVSGLTATGLVLEDNGGDAVVVDADGDFRFATLLADGASYTVTVATAPAGQDCLVANGTGTVIGADVLDVEVTCFAAGSCPAMPITYTSDGMFTLPTGCSTVIVDAFGGGGAGGAKHKGNAAAAGGAGGHATLTLAGQSAGTMYAVAIGRGGTCELTSATPGGYTGGRGGTSGGSGVGGTGAGPGNGGLGGAGSGGGSQPGGAGGPGGYGGGGGGGGGDTAHGNPGGGATVVKLVSPSTELVIAGGGGGAGAADQNGDKSGPGGAACAGYNGADGTPAITGPRAGGGGGGGACACVGGTCNVLPSSTGGAGGAAGANQTCDLAQNGAAGHVVITFQ